MIVTTVVTNVTTLDHRLYKRNGRNIRDITHWFVDCCLEASFRSGQRHLENFRCMLGKKEHGFYLYGHDAAPWAEVWAEPTAERGGCDWLRGLDLEDIGQSTCQSRRSHALMHTLLYRQI